MPQREYLRGGEKFLNSSTNREGESEDETEKVRERFQERVFMFVRLSERELFGFRDGHFWKDCHQSGDSFDMGQLEYRSNYTPLNTLTHKGSSKLIKKCL